MNSGSLVYQKGDLVTMKQASLVCQIEKDMDGTLKRSFRRLSDPLSGVFLGFLDKRLVEDNDDLDYLNRSAAMKTPCRIAVGKSIYYVDEKSFFFHNIQRS